MAYSYIEYISDGSTVIYNVPFDYIDKENISITVNDMTCLDVTYTTASGYYNADMPEYRWVEDNSIQFVFSPLTGDVIEIQRNTEKNTVVVDFANGAILDEADLDLALLQALYNTQEAYDLMDIHEVFLAEANVIRMLEETTVLWEDCALYWNNLANATATAESVDSWETASVTLTDGLFHFSIPRAADGQVPTGIALAKAEVGVDDGHLRITVYGLDASDSYINDDGCLLLEFNELSVEDEE